jgi:hypothetical protein
MIEASHIALNVEAIWFGGSSLEERGDLVKPFVERSPDVVIDYTSSSLVIELFYAN